MTAVDWSDGRLRFIDQTQLPHREVYVETADYRRVGEAIRKLQIRGAPAIGVAAAFGLFLAAQASPALTKDQLSPAIDEAFEFLSRTRPTAVNLFTALNRMRRAFRLFNGSDVIHLRKALFAEARAIQQEDIDACARIGELGATLIHPGSTILTHCNAGILATAGSGTALSVITTAAAQGKIVGVYVDETRPLFQGARLTSWELVRQKIPVTLITDSTAGIVIRQRRVDAIITGADRIAANGDAANKIGTYPLAVLARYHGIPLYIAAPTSTLDPATPTGDSITIEERDPQEVTHVAGVRIAAEGVHVFAPAFDITPNEFIEAIVTEAGILRQPFTMSIAGLFRHGS